MRAYLVQYDQLRADTSGFIAKVDSEGSTFDEAYQVLGDGASARENLKSSIAALHAPTAAVASAQSRLVSVLSESVAGIKDAISGLEDYQFDQDSYDFDYKSAPGWKAFEAASTRISAQYAAARNQWQSRLDAHRRTVATRGLPPRPVI
jgi:hypothetical protein